MRRRASAALVNEQHELAFRERRVRDKGQDPDRDSLAAGWREEIWRLRAVVQRARSGARGCELVRSVTIYALDAAPNTNDLTCDSPYPSQGTMMGGPNCSPLKAGRRQRLRTPGVVADLVGSFATKSAEVSRLRASAAPGSRSKSGRLGAQRIGRPRCAGRAAGVCYSDAGGAGNCR